MVAPRSDKGYSLTELVVVLAVLALAAGIAVPAIHTTFHSWQLSADTRAITTALSSAKIKAISQMTRYQITFDLAGNNWTLQKFDRISQQFGNDQPAITLSGGVANSGICFKATVPTPVSGFSSSSSTFIRFNTRGIPINAAAVPTPGDVIYLADGSTDYAVTVSTVGSVGLWKYTAGQWAAGVK